MAQCRFVESAVAISFRVCQTELRAPSRRRARVAFARQVAMYLAHVSFGLTYTDIGRCFDRDRTTVAHACRLVEDRRDAPSLDAALDYLEAAVRLRADGDLHPRAATRIFA
ncbi:MAG: helix-turn-helix domain-containing protein [Hyphomicrobiales bacterium]